ncbi:MAG TPA: DNA double-strand break repair nuclease NurA [Anaerolineaceae bacterium]|nr:DNA double-strand break repair nuclease NurA [Anaerolineaceae bacterium]
MPVNFQQLREQIHEMGQNAPALQAERQDRLDQASRLLNELANDLPALTELVGRAAALAPHLRCATPAAEPLDFTAPARPPDPHLTLLAADGSQINPSAHDSVPFGVINVGVFEMHPGQGSPPRVHTRSRLLTPEEVFTDHGMLGEEVVALMRDLREREELLELARQHPVPVITLTDGPLELYHEPQDNARFRRELQHYTEVLEELAAAGVVAAGYVEKSRSDLLVRLLELAQLDREGRLAQAGKDRPFKFITDIELLRSRIGPGERSAVLGIQTAAEGHFTGRLAVHYFYINVSPTAKPYLARVEIPAWVAQSQPLVALLHGALLWQCQQMGAHASPYALHRAHEVAVVRLDEKQQIEDMITAELRRQKVAVEQKSHKQANKELPGKRRRP